ncbi:hypothetical protein BG74_00720 [Sodalis-like endosymbiont of Proechinophthirus fluctus]|nr:hypothetical protein BG74_00720 [Sodalis-like endosymbiont of Proechinophthirus fluctus]
MSNEVGVDGDGDGDGDGDDEFFVVTLREEKVARSRHVLSKRIDRQIEFILIRNNNNNNNLKSIRVCACVFHQRIFFFFCF